MEKVARHMRMKAQTQVVHMKMLMLAHTSRLHTWGDECGTLVRGLGAQISPTKVATLW